ncbi:MAG: HlyC/CorC family transporter [Gammaproteobacteria bacterium]|nr:HlyC/CorC family transporter [Gammaproteobacteria bacterium]
MSRADLIALLVVLVCLIFVSAFFSASETGMMSLNRYRIRHLARTGDKTAIRVSLLLERPDRLLGVILTGNTFANILASSIGTILAVHFFGDFGVAISTVLLTFFILVFGEMAPKTMAALHAQTVSMKASGLLFVLLKILYPVVWLINLLANGFLALFNVKLDKTFADRLSAEELRSVVLESSGRISQQHQEMLLRILEMEKVTVEDIMIPRNEIRGIDLNDDWDKVLAQLTNSTHTKLPVYKDDIDNVVGVLHLREALKLLGQNGLNAESLLTLVREAYFIPEGTPLHVQLLNFRSEQRRSALVVDEYGDIQGLITLEDILEEIVGEFKTEVPAVSKFITPHGQGGFNIDGSVNIRELNRLMGWNLPMNGPKTLSGVITEYLETIPQEQTCLRLAGYPIEILEVQGNLVRSVYINPVLYLVPTQS